MSNMMKAVVMRGANDYGVEMVEIPKPKQNEVLVRVKAVAICGSDPKIFNGGFLKANWPPYFPFTPGHEFAGEVVALGEGVTGLSVGDRVAGEAHCGCGVCENCRKGLYNLCLNYGNIEAGHRHYGFTTPGAYAQYNVYNVKALTKMPDNVSFEEGSMVDTGGTALQAIRLTGITPGGYSVVFGPGPVGLFVMKVAKAMGSNTIVVGRRERLQFAKGAGANHIIDTESGEDIVAKIKEITGGIGADEVFETAGTQEAMLQSVRSARKNGKVAILSLPVQDEYLLPVKTMVMNQIAVFGSRANPSCSKDVLSLISEGRLDVKDMITHTFAIDDFQKAMDTFINRIDGALKVVITP